jgi:hypothetical protein
VYDDRPEASETRKKLGKKISAIHSHRRDTPQPEQLTVAGILVVKPKTQHKP